MKKISVLNALAIAGIIGFNGMVQAEEFKWNLEIGGNGHTYEVIECGTWIDCKNKAEEKDFHLVTISNNEEQSWLVKTFGSDTIFWIGLTDENEEGVWEWVNGENIVFTNWVSGEPNNSSTCNLEENHAGMNRSTNGQWNDYAEDCYDAPTKAIIEIEEQECLNQADINNAIEICKADPASCGIDISGGGYTQADLDAAYQNGMNNCKNNPSACGINASGGTPATVSNSLDLHVPFANYDTLLGTMSIWAEFDFIGENDSGELLWKLSDYGAIE